VHHDISLDKVRTIDDLLGGEFVHKNSSDAGAFFEDDEPRFVAGEWRPRCPEAESAIRKGIEVILRTQTKLYTQNRQEAYVEVIQKLDQYLRRSRSKSHRITNRKFLKHPNRGGWLCLFAKLTTRGWLRARITKAKGDERVRFAFETGVVPKATFTAELQAANGKRQAKPEKETTRQRIKRYAADDELLKWGHLQFAEKRGRGPADMTPVSDYAESRLIEHQVSHGEAELVAIIRQEVARLSPADRGFFEEYMDSRYQGRRTDADRKRFQRLRERIRRAILD
jgi:hypothetical protein